MYYRINLRGDGLHGVGSRPVEIQWDSQKVQKVLQKVLPPVKRNPALIPLDLRNKPPKVHVNYYPDTTTSTEAIPTPTRLYYTPPPRKINKITPPQRKITPQPPRKVTVTKDLILYPTPPPRKVTRPPRKTSYFPKFPEYFPDTKRPNTVDFARPSYNRRNDEQISLNTEYFIKKSDFFKTTTQKSTLAPSGGRLGNPSSSQDADQPFANIDTSSIAGMDCLDIDLLVKNHHLPDAATNRASNPSGTYTFRF